MTVAPGRTARSAVPFQRWCWPWPWRPARSGPATAPRWSPNRSLVLPPPRPRGSRTTTTSRSGGTSAAAPCECGELEVPLDYAAPDGERLTLAVLRVPSTHADRTIGSLVVNPGGPGGSGVEYAAARRSYFRTRCEPPSTSSGSTRAEWGSSTPIDCLTDIGASTPSSPRIPVRTPPREARTSECLDPGVRQGASTASGDLTRHVSTEEAARDIDVLRGRTRRGAAGLLRRVLRDVPRCDVRRPASRTGRTDGPRRRCRPVAATRSSRR